MCHPLPEHTCPFKIEKLQSHISIAAFAQPQQQGNAKNKFTWWEIISQGSGVYPCWSLWMTVQLVPWKQQQTGEELQQNNPLKNNNGKLVKTPKNYKIIEWPIYMVPTKPFLWQTKTQKAGQVLHRHQWNQTAVNLTESKT